MGRPGRTIEAARAAGSEAVGVHGVLPKRLLRASPLKCPRRVGEQAAGQAGGKAGQMGLWAGGGVGREAGRRASPLRPPYRRWMPGLPSSAAGSLPSLSGLIRPPPSPSAPPSAGWQRSPSGRGGGSRDRSGEPRSPWLGNRSSHAGFELAARVNACPFRGASKPRLYDYALGADAAPTRTFCWCQVACCSLPCSMASCTMLFYGRIA